MKTLIWKEWREHQLFFFLAVGIIVLIRIVPYFFPLPEKMLNYDLYMTACCFILPILFSLFLGAISFTGEFIKNTKSFFFSQPLTSKRLFWTKFFSDLILLFALIFLTQFVFLVLPFKGITIFSIHITTVDWLIFILFVPLSMVILYSAACFSSFLLKNILPAIICTPFVLIFGILLVLPLAVVLFLISPSLVVFNFFVFSVLIATFLIFSFLTWQKAIVKDVSPTKTIFRTAIVILLISFAVHAIANLAATWKLSKTIQQAEAAGIKLTIQEIIPSPVPGKGNAAPVYQQAFDLADKLEAKHKIKVPIPKSWSAQWDAEWKKLRSEQEVAIAKDPEFTRLYGLIQKATNLSSCRFDVKYEEGPSMHLSHLSKMRNLARLIAIRTSILIQEGRYEEALELAKTGLRLGDSLANEPILTSQLVRIAVDRIAADSFKQMLNNSNVLISVKDYQSLILEIDKKNKQINKGLKGDLPLDGLYSFRLGLGETRTIIHDKYYRNGKEVTDFAGIMGYVFHGCYFPLYWKFYGSYLGRSILKGDYVFYLQSFSTLMELSQKPYFSAESAISEWEREISPRRGFERYPLSSLRLPTFSRVLTSQAQYVAILDSFKLALVLKIYKQKHGYYPDKLFSLSPEIIPELSLDPFTGKDYIYRKESRGFIVYSVGSNERDDNGIYDPKQSQKFDDIAWKVTN